MSTKNYTKIRFSASDAALVLIDQQSGVMQLVHDYSPAELRNNVVGLAKLGKIFTLPTVLTSSSDQGPNGPIIPELLSMFPGAPLIRRTTGTISAWDYPEFVAAIDSFESKTTKAVQKAS
jgi:nicotinamidase-related amidase